LERWGDCCKTGQWSVGVGISALAIEGEMKNDMRRIHIVGRKNSGKTRLVVDLVEALTGRGLRIGTIKHTHHQHELDTPGKDSWAHRQAGASIVGVLARNMTAVFLPHRQQHDQPDQQDQHGQRGDREDRFEEIEPLLEACDWVIVEGNLATKAPKIEVWRSENDSAPLYPDDPGILAVVSDTPLRDPAPQRQFPRSDLEPLIQWLSTEFE